MQGTIKLSFASVSVDDKDIKKLHNYIKQRLKRRKQKMEDNKLQNLRIGFWLQETGACIEKAVVKCSKKDIRNRLKIENLKEPFRLLLGYRISINDFFNDDEFIERPEVLSGYDEYKKGDFDVNCFIGPEIAALRVII